MYAVIETGGRQLRVAEGQTVRVERLAGAPGDALTLERVLLLGAGSQVQIGTPLVPGARVMARVVRQGRGKKIRVFKFKAKAHYRRRQGHRQAFTELRIERIEGPGVEAARTAQAAALAAGPAEAPAAAARPTAKTKAPAVKAKAPAAKAKPARDKTAPPPGRRGRTSRPTPRKTRDRKT